MKLKALIVDEDYLDRRELRYALGNYSNIEVIGEAANAHEALELIKALDYQVIFVDLAMPGMSGMEIVNKLQDLQIQPHIIVVSDHEVYAYSAFELNAVDYLLKPVEPARLTKAVGKVVKLVQDATVLAEVAATSDNTGQLARENLSKLSQQRSSSQIKIDRIPAGKHGKIVLVTESDIFYAFTEQDYVYIKTDADKLFTRFTLKELEARLDQQIFFRTHRCYLVNLHKVKEIVPFFNGTYNLIVADKEGSEVPVSRAQAKKLRRILGF